MRKQTDDFFDIMTKTYLDEIAAQTRGSYRVKSANAHGSLLVSLLNKIRNTEAEQCIGGYLVRAQQRARLATSRPRQDFGSDERLTLVVLLFERLAFEALLKLDEMEAIGAVDRVCRCARCESWFWRRVENQRYCSEKCRVRHHHTSSEGRRYKREWARKEYQRNKKRNEEARQSATGIRALPRSR